MSSDARRPVDVLLRRTAALLEHLRGLPGTPMEQLTACGRELAALKKTASGPAGDDPAFFRQVCAVQRRIALANPLLDAEALLFTGYCGENIIQGQQISTTGRAAAGAGLYRRDGLRGPRPVLSDVLADRTVGDGPLSGRLTNGDWSGRALFYAMDLDYDGRRLVFTWAQRSARDLMTRRRGWISPPSQQRGDRLHAGLPYGSMRPSGRPDPDCTTANCVHG